MGVQKGGWVHAHVESGVVDAAGQLGSGAFTRANTNNLRAEFESVRQTAPADVGF